MGRVGLGVAAARIFTTATAGWQHDMVIETSDERRSGGVRGGGGGCRTGCRRVCVEWTMETRVWMWMYKYVCVCRTALKGRDKNSAVSRETADAGRGRERGRERERAQRAHQRAQRATMTGNLVAGCPRGSHPYGTLLRTCDTNAYQRLPATQHIGRLAPRDRLDPLAR